MQLSPQKHPVLARLIGAVMLVVFSGWFVLPSCHCQWDLLLGDSPSQTESSETSFDLDQGSLPDQPCLCDDCPPKTFETPTGFGSGNSLQKSSFLALSSATFPGPAGFLHDSLSRGPPRDLKLLPAEPRTYLRHCSLLL